MAPHADALTLRTCEFSRYARHALQADPELLNEGDISEPFGLERMRTFIDAGDTEDGAVLGRRLRELRKRVMLRIMARDLSGYATLAEVVSTISDLADLSITAAVSHLERQLTAQYGMPRGASPGDAQKLHVVAMGKLGGRELNVSSDIDLIFLYPEEGETDGTRPISNHEYFARLSRRLIAMLSELTADGFVFRVDMRLRPFGAEGPLACSFDMLENYFITQGREWERYAWIKARTVCGDRADALNAIVRPFVYRRHLDYSAFDSLRELHQQVRREVERKDIIDNIKLGPGGIREIEFIAQAFQLIRGGRENALRQTPTLAVLPLLSAGSFLPPGAVDELKCAYVFLRNLEHRLQYLDDQQTQMLPRDIEDQRRIAMAMGSDDVAAFRARLEHHRAVVTRYFEDLFANGNERAHPLLALWLDGDEPAQCQQLAELGYQDPAGTLAIITALRNSARIRQMPEASHARMQRLVPLAVEASAGLPTPDLTLKSMLAFLESISRRESYLSLLLQYPQTVRTSARLASGSPWAADYLTRHPILLDELLNTNTLYAAPDSAQMRAQLRQALDDADGDTERQMDALRHFKHSQTIHLIAQDLEGLLTIEKLSDYLSDLADLILTEALRVVWQALRTRHREQPLFAVIAYGKLGGKELGYESDLDLIFLHRDEAAEAATNYARLAQRLNTWLTSLTPAGVLYETDLRLRPDGAGGLLVSSLDGFAAYQYTKAWVWEHQALTRARWVAGDPDIGKGFDDIRDKVLCQPRDLEKLASEVVEMRARMLQAHPNASGAFDIKHDRGGLIDVEFIVQYLVLGHAHRHPELTGNIGNLALLKLAARLNLIKQDDADAVHHAYRRLRQLQHTQRLRGGKYARVEMATMKQEIAAVRDLWMTVLRREPA